MKLLCQNSIETMVISYFFIRKLKEIIKMRFFLGEYVKNIIIKSTTLNVNTEISINYALQQVVVNNYFIFL